MLLKDVVEEIQEKAPNNFLSPKSIVRKITQVRDRLIRTYGTAQQQSEVVTTAIDLWKGQSLYIPPCPPGNVTDVDIYDTAYGGAGRWRRIQQKQFNLPSPTGPYYYFVAGKIGIYPVPTANADQGIKIHHIPVIPPLTLADMNKETEFDPDFDMVLVYGVLREISDNNDYEIRYQQLLMEYQTANSGYEVHVIQERW